MQMANLSGRNNHVAFRVDSVISKSRRALMDAHAGHASRSDRRLHRRHPKLRRAPTGGSFGTSKRCVSRADSDSIASVTASRNRLVQGNEKVAGQQLRDRQADQDSIDDALYRVVV